ncbi:hypothetical protein cand_021370 [Cryptosporidium andersoni]|uniref:Uncharacterized protein n=1 Tax=Cryptosporidium andersoni TaxID=117008 RepID=A0A1J4MUR1_9CRYT|nr:hypothetical protein cand_021370 [Cryptosporidium andersoni]
MTSLKFSLLNLNIDKLTEEQMRCKLEDILDKFEYMRNKGLRYQRNLFNCEMEASNKEISSALCTRCKHISEKILKVHIYLLELKMQYEKLNKKLRLYKYVSEDEDDNKMPRENLELYYSEPNDISLQTQNSNTPLLSPSSNHPLDNDKKSRSQVEFVKEIMELGESVKSILKPAKERSLRQIEEKCRQIESKQKNKNSSNISHPVSTNDNMRIKSSKDIISSNTSNLNSANIDDKNKENPSNDSFKGNIDTSSYLDNMNLRKRRRKKGISRADVKKISDMILDE